MERVKSIIQRIFPNNGNQRPEGVKQEHVITIDAVDGRVQVQPRMPPGMAPKEKIPCRRILMEVLLLIICCAILIASLSRFPDEPPTPKDPFHDYAPLVRCCILLLVLCVLTKHRQASMSRVIEKLTPKITIRLQRSTKIRILRIRRVGSREFLETEIEDTKLTYANLVEVCAKELKFDTAAVKGFWKIPSTKIRGDADVRRFRSLEYIEVDF